jgi:leucyl aminopeptidase
MSADALTPVCLVDDAHWGDAGVDGLQLSPAARAYARVMGFEPKAGRILPLPGVDGTLEAVLFGLGSDAGLATSPFALGKLATDLPAGAYRLEGTLANPDLAFLGFLLGSYRFDRFKSGAAPQVTLAPPPGCKAAEVEEIARAVKAGRDLINLPANALGVEDLARAAHRLAETHGTSAREIIGEDLLAQNFPLIHTVGRASAVAPRLIDFTWGDSRAPKVTLVGKGVVFDTGGLNLKPDNSMLLMKKDMGGAAAALTAADILMTLDTPIRLRVILPIVENSVAGSSFRPGDIYTSRKGLSVEIGNTDAEGRLVLADALALADEDNPDLIIDFATLTGAARVALGPDLPPFYTEEDALAGAIAAAGEAVNDPVWRLPLWKPYAAMIDSKVADINNAGVGGFAGSITAALFLRRFVRETTPWVHFDIYGWTPSAKPGRPEGGEPQAARLVAEFIRKKYLKP